MFDISGRSPWLSRAASSASRAAAASPLASSCCRMRLVSSVKNRMRPENLMWSGRFSIVPVISASTVSLGPEFLLVLCYFLGKQSDYNLTLIKPLTGFPASKPRKIWFSSWQRRRVEMKVFGRRLMWTALMALAAVTFGSRQAPVFGQTGPETDDPVKIQIYDRFRENRVPNPAAAYQAAQDYMQKYRKDKDQYTEYLQKWI